MPSSRRCHNHPSCAASWACVGRLKVWTWVQVVMPPPHLAPLASVLSPLLPPLLSSLLPSPLSSHLSSRLSSYLSSSLLAQHVRGAAQHLRLRHDQGGDCTAACFAEFDHQATSCVCVPPTATSGSSSSGSSGSSSSSGSGGSSGSGSGSNGGRGFREFPSAGNAIPFREWLSLYGAAAVPSGVYAPQVLLPLPPPRQVILPCPCRCLYPSPPRLIRSCCGAATLAIG